MVIKAVEEFLHGAPQSRSSRTGPTLGGEIAPSRPIFPTHAMWSSILILPFKQWVEKPRHLFLFLHLHSYCLLRLIPTFIEYLQTKVGFSSDAKRFVSPFPAGLPQDVSIAPTVCSLPPLQTALCLSTSVRVCLSRRQWPPGGQSQAVSVLLFPGPKFWEHNPLCHQEKGSCDAPPATVSVCLSLSLSLDGCSSFTWAQMLGSLRTQVRCLHFYPSTGHPP